ncbi:MAG: DUF2318 domain-containing protein [Candidatus Aenigmatarchaeota archaeon]
MKKNALIVMLVILAAFLIPSAYLSFTGKATGIGASDSVTVPVSDIGTTAKFYEYTSLEGKTVRFFAVKDSTGTIRTAFDACDVCYSFHKGFRQEGGYMVCNNCGKKYAIDTIGTQNKAGGGCWPGYLPSTVSGDSLLVKKADLEAGAWRF